MFKEELKEYVRLVNEGVIDLDRDSEGEEISEAEYVETSSATAAAPDGWTTLLGVMSDATQRRAEDQAEEIPGPMELPTPSSGSAAATAPARR